MRVKKYLCSMILPAVLLGALAIAGYGDEDSGGTATTAPLTMKSSVAQKTVSARGLERLWELFRPRTLHAAVSGITDSGGNTVTDILPLRLPSARR